MASGTDYVYADTAAPFDCAVTPATGTLTLTPLPQSTDTDGDGCTDYRELGDNPSWGGLRDPFNPYDYFDINHDGAINVPVDILGVSAAFGTPSSNPRYVDYKDRAAGPANPGPNSWNKGPPNGSIDTPEDILGVSKQFGHSCLPGHSHVGTALGPHPTTVLVAVTAGQTAPFVVTLATTAGYPASGQLLIDAETVAYDQTSCGSINTSTQVCVTARGNHTPTGNDPADHPAGAIVYQKTMTTLSGTVTAAQAAPFAMGVASTAGFATSGHLLVDAETMTYDQNSGSCPGLVTATQFCITARGTAVQHGAGAPAWQLP